jgi:hypothetical protein
MDDKDYTSPRVTRHIVEHRDGRACRADQGEWIIERAEMVLRRGDFSPNMNMKCLRVHPITAEKIDATWMNEPPVEIDVTEQVKEGMFDRFLVGDRPQPPDLDFGHPGIGFQHLHGSRFDRAPFDLSPIPNPDTESDDCGEVEWELSPGAVQSVPNPQAEWGFKRGEFFRDFGDQGFNVPPATPEASAILERVLPRLIERFLEKNRKYSRVDEGHDLGLKGIVPDLNRKTGVIISRIWHGDALVDEDTTEVMEDAVGHLLLMLGKIELMEED